MLRAGEMGRGHATAPSGSFGEEHQHFENNLYFCLISLLQWTCAKQCLLLVRPILGATQPEGFDQDKPIPIPPLPLLQSSVASAQGPILVRSLTPYPLEQHKVSCSLVAPARG